MKHVVITGASGFIGGYLCQWLARHGYYVTACSRTWSGALTEALAGCYQLRWDVLESKPPEGLPPADILIHTATANDIESKDAERSLLLSGIGTRNVLTFAAQAGIPRAIVFSTLQVYGTELKGVVDESTVVSPLNDYGLNHLVAEEYAALMTRQGRIRAVSVRPANVYGRFAVPTVNRWTLVPGCFCKEAYETGEIVLRSSGLQHRNFVSLENIALACQSILQNFPRQYENYNIASSGTATILSAAQTVKRLFETRFDRPVKLRIESSRPYSSNSFSVALDKLQALGFVEDTQHTLETEIEAVFDFLTRKVLV